MFSHPRSSATPSSHSPSLAPSSFAKIRLAGSGAHCPKGKGGTNTLMPIGARRIKGLIPLRSPIEI